MLSSSDAPYYLHPTSVIFSTNNEISLEESLSFLSLLFSIRAVLAERFQYGNIKQSGRIHRVKPGHLHKRLLFLALVLQKFFTSSPLPLRRRLKSKSSVPEADHRPSVASTQNLTQAPPLQSLSDSDWPPQTPALPAADVCFFLLIFFFLIDWGLVSSLCPRFLPFPAEFVAPLISMD